jgi:cytochrome d ubiquinol oxidase subunit II
MVELLAAVMVVAATLYAVLAGADFGVGLVEPLVDRKGRERIDLALSPVWEANHVWLVLLAVLAFVGFPRLYTVVSTYLHVPLMLMLLGIVARGTAFTFRHYDPDPGALRPLYSWVFRAASFLTPLFLGIVVATTASGTLIDAPERGFYAAFIAPWNTLFAWTTGLFVCALFAFEGAALLAAEYAPRGEDAPLPYLRVARTLHAVAIALGGLVFVAAYIEQAPFFAAMLARPASIACIVLATLLVPVVARAFARGRPWTLRIATGAQAALVFSGFVAAQFPVLVRITPHDVRYPDDAAPPATVETLLLAVAIGLVAIVPSLIYLLRVFKAAPPRGER